MVRFDLWSCTVMEFLKFREMRVQNRGPAMLIRFMQMKLWRVKQSEEK